MCKTTDPNLFGSIYRKVIGAIGKVENIANKAKQVGGAIAKGQVKNAIRDVKQV
jgi:hypothetical protein